MCLSSTPRTKPPSPSCSSFVVSPCRVLCQGVFVRSIVLAASFCGVWRFALPAGLMGSLLPRPIRSTALWPALNTTLLLILSCCHAFMFIRLAHVRLTPALIHDNENTTSRLATAWHRSIRAARTSQE